MATNIGTAAAFTTTNLKPYAGEQLDALWGQNIADNTGYMYYRPFPGPSFFAPAYNSAGGGTVNGTFYFRKETSFNQFSGTVVGTHISGNNVMSVKMDGTTVFSQNYSSTATLFKASFATSITHLTNGNYYECTFNWGAGANSGPAGMAVTTYQIS